jgi:orotidine 5'-phosphate decarboxylase subfamily 2|uniref:Orotidine-5'-phosphate decarboxylase n=1 Tax=Mesoaciditoga lauensis TaxID=1495039 RepID=A0A7V3REN6_9BACT
MKFIDKLRRRMDEVKNVLAIGLDTDIERLPEKFSKDSHGMYEFNCMIIESTKNLACAYKINSAFYESSGYDGMRTLQKTRDLIGDIPVIYDAKRGDIESTAKAYAKAAFELFDFDAITLSPYMGEDALNPFLKYEEKYSFVLCLSSNKSADNFEYHGEPPLYSEVAHLVNQKNYESGNCGLVVGATVAGRLAEISKMAPKSLILIPGIGTQGGDAYAVMHSVDHQKIIVNVSRAIIFADDPVASAMNYSKILSF